MFRLDSSVKMKAALWQWKDSIGTGVPTISNKDLPYYGTVYIFHNILGLSLIHSQMGLYYLLFSIGGISAYFFFVHQTILLKRNSWRVQFAGFAAASIYMFNTYWMIYVWQIFSLEAFLYATLPLILLLFQKGLETSNNSLQMIKIVLGLTAVSMFASPALGNPALSIPLAIGTGVFFAVMMLGRTGVVRVRRQLRFLLASTSAIFLANLWWFYPEILLYQTQLVRAGGSSASFVDLISK